MHESFAQDHAPSGIAALPSLAWGSHLGQLYSSAADLRDLLVPYFKAGLDNNERCLWVTGEPFSADEARAALRAAVPDLDAREQQGQIEIQDLLAFYDPNEPLQPEAILAGLLQRENDALGQISRPPLISIESLQTILRRHQHLGCASSCMYKIGARSR